MTLLSCLLPATPPEPSGARVVRLLGGDEIANSEAKLAANRRWYARNKEAQAAAQRERYWEAREANRNAEARPGAVPRKD